MWLYACLFMSPPMERRGAGCVLHHLLSGSSESWPTGLDVAPGSKDEPSVDTGHDLWFALKNSERDSVPNRLGKLRPSGCGTVEENVVIPGGSRRSQQWPWSGPRGKLWGYKRRSWVSRRNQSTEGNVGQNKNNLRSRYSGSDSCLWWGAATAVTSSLNR